MTGFIAGNRPPIASPVRSDPHGSEDVDVVNLQNLRMHAEEKLQDLVEAAILISVDLSETNQQAVVRPPPRQNTLKNRAATARAVLRKDGSKFSEERLTAQDLSNLLRDESFPKGLLDDELDEKILQDILEDLRSGDEPEVIIGKIKDKLGADPYLMDRAMTVLLYKHTDGRQIVRGNLRNSVEAALELFKDEHHDEIEIGTQITAKIRSSRNSEKLGSPIELRSFYSDHILGQTGQPKTSDVYFKLKERFGMSGVTSACEYYLAALGGNLRNRHLSNPAELMAYRSMICSLQALVNLVRVSIKQMQVVPYALDYYRKQNVQQS